MNDITHRAYGCTERRWPPSRAAECYDAARTPVNSNLGNLISGPVLPGIARAGPLLMTCPKMRNPVISMCSYVGK